MSDITNDIDALLAYLETVPRPDLRANLTALVAERDGLRAELAAMQKQRDEARRDACVFQSILKFSLQHPKGITSTEATLRLAKEIAVERGWDCFMEGGGA